MMEEWKSGKVEKWKGRHFRGVRAFRHFVLAIFFFLIIGNIATAQWLLVPMEYGKQTNHLKAYGLTYWALPSAARVSVLLVVELSRGCVRFTGFTRRSRPCCVDGCPVLSR